MSSFRDKLNIAIQEAHDKAEASIIKAWKQCKNVEGREALHAEQRALVKVLNKLKKEIRDE